jgi:hypothetical protein
MLRLGGVNDIGPEKADTYGMKSHKQSYDRKIKSS